MDSKLKELTEKLYTEGVSKGQTEADKILEAAKEKAKEIENNATVNAQEIIKKAEEKAAEINKKTHSELVMASNQAIGSLKQEITNLISEKIVDHEVKSSLQNSKFMSELILTTVQEWIKQEKAILTISPEMEKEITEYFNTKAKSLLENEVKIETISGIKAGFIISPLDKSYKVNFTEETFINYFKEFIRPGITEMLFGKQNK